MRSAAPQRRSTRRRRVDDMRVLSLLSGCSMLIPAATTRACARSRARRPRETAHSSRSLRGSPRCRARTSPRAHASFAQAQQSGGDFALYAQYMDALATVSSDSSKRVSALATLQTLSESNRGAFAEQVRLSAAQTALGVGSVRSGSVACGRCARVERCRRAGAAHESLGTVSRRKFRGRGDRVRGVREAVSVSPRTRRSAAHGRPDHAREREERLGREVFPGRR